MRFYISSYTRCTIFITKVHNFFFDVLLYLYYFLPGLNAMHMKNCRLHFFRVSNGFSLSNETLMSNETQMKLSIIEHRTKPLSLLKLFQSCVKDRESYPMVQLTCTEYGKLFKNISLLSSLRKIRKLAFKVFPEEFLCDT